MARFQVLETRNMLATDIFGSQIAISSVAASATSVVAADLDGDGDMDALSASAGDDKIAWYENSGNQIFTEHTISNNADSATSLLVADVNGDGNLDVLSASSLDDKIAWYENDGSQNFLEHAISTTADGAQSVYAADVDGDGDLDLLSASYSDDKIAWYENDGSQNFLEHVISTMAVGARSVFAVDIDGDGAMDVLSASFLDDKIAWYQNDGSQNFTELSVGTAFRAQSVFATDLDGDGDLDILSASRNDDKITWHQNDGSQNFTPQTISSTADGAQNVYAADVDGDGDLDVLSASLLDDKIAWYQNDGYQNFTVRTISTTADGARSVFAADMDNDGDLDILSASQLDNKVAWYENVGNDFGDAPNPYPTTLVQNGARHATTGPSLGATRAEEPDGIHSASANAEGAEEDGVLFGAIRVGAVATVTVTVQEAIGKLDAWIDFNGDGAWGGPHEQIFTAHDVVVGDNLLTFDVPSDAITGTTYARFRVSTDGALGVIGAAVDGEVEDYQVTLTHPAAASGVFSAQNTVSTATIGANSVLAADLDGDGDIDTLSASTADDTIVWHENDGNSNFTTHTISTDANRATSLFVSDVDGDGDLDVLSASASNDTIAWHENDGSQNFFPHTINTSADGARSVFAADVDGDGDLDVLSASYADDKIVWHENDGSQNFSPHTISSSADGASGVFAVDIDGDGDLDVLSASFLDDKIAWYENADLRSDFDHDQDVDGYDLLAWQRGFRTNAPNATHADGDANYDLNVDGNDFDAWKIQFGKQKFTTHTISTTAHGANSLFAVDMNGDGNLDVLSASSLDGTIVWHKNENHRSDFDRDQDVDGFDLLVWQRGFGISAPNATIATGDADGDQDVDGDDLTIWENELNKPKFTAYTINTSANETQSLYPADLDGDGDLDLLSASYADDRITWHQNDGSQNFTEQIIDTSTAGASSVFAADMDRDGDLDVLSASRNDNKIAWHENLIVDLSYVVDSVIDENDGDHSPGNLSLREAIGMANASVGSDTITFDQSLDGSTILLAMGELGLTKTVTLDATSLASGLTIDAQMDSRIFNITATNGDFTFAGITLTGGTPSDQGHGGAIRSSTNGHLTIDQSTIMGSHTAGPAAQGGGIHAFNDVTISNSTIHGNHTEGSNGFGGGVSSLNGTVLLTNSTISENYTLGLNAEGGGVYASGDITITNSQIRENSTMGEQSDGGGLFSNGNVTLTSSTVSGNSSIGKSGGIFANHMITMIDSTTSDNSTSFGGGLVSAMGDILLTNSAVRGNHSSGFAGGIHAGNGNVVLTQSSVSGNTGVTGAGGIFAYSLTLTNSTVSGNLTESSSAHGGGISTDTNGSVTITNSTISGNSAGGSGGGIFTLGSDLTITNSTLSGNSASDSGGGIEISEATFSQILNSTISDNSAGTLGGGISMMGTLEMGHSILAGNFSSGTGPDLAQGVLPLTVSYSLIGNNDESLLAPAPVGSPDSDGNLIGTVVAPIDPLLGPLSNNGGSTLTHALLLGSPAIDAGDNTFAEPPDFDQRFDSFARKAGLRIDMGAYERQTVLQNVQIVVDTITDEVNGDLGPGNISLREAIGLANGNVDSADTILFDPSLSGQVLELSMGEFRIIESLTITGLGADHLTIDAAGQSRIFNLDDDDDTTAQDISISGLTLTGGVTQESGGAILSKENLTLSQSAIDANQATESGGGIYFELNSTDLSTIRESTISNNFTTDANSTGGGIFITNSGSGTVHILSSTVSGNRTNDDGGGLFIQNSSATIHVEYSTITGNISDADQSGEGVGGGVYLNEGSLNINHTIVAANLDLTLGAADIRKAVFGSLTSSFSLIGDNAGSSLPSAPIGSPDPQGNLIGTFALPIHPLLGPLTKQGGPTNTHALLIGSPAIDAGNPILTVPPASDQRGLNRIEDGDGNGSSVIDIGAYELEALVAMPALGLDIDGDTNGNVAGNSQSVRNGPYDNPNPIPHATAFTFMTRESRPEPSHALKNRSGNSKPLIIDDVFLLYVSNDFFSATLGRPYDLTSKFKESVHRSADILRHHDESFSTKPNSWASVLDELFARDCCDRSA